MSQADTSVCLSVDGPYRRLHMLWFVGMLHLFKTLSETTQLPPESCREPRARPCSSRNSQKTLVATLVS